jgi:hypothetical protein
VIWNDNGTDQKRTPLNMAISIWIGSIIRHVMSPAVASAFMIYTH